MNSMDRLRCVCVCIGDDVEGTLAVRTHLAMPHEPFLQVHTWNSRDERLRKLLYR